MNVRNDNSRLLCRLSNIAAPPLTSLRPSVVMPFVPLAARLSIFLFSRCGLGRIGVKLRLPSVWVVEAIKPLYEFVSRD